MTVAIFGLWRNWVVAVGVLTVLAFLAPIVPRVWLLPIDIVAYIGLQIMRRVQRGRHVPSCMRLIQEVSTIVLISACLISLICILTPTGLIRDISGNQFTADTPLLAILITAPTTCIVTACFLLNRTEPHVCRQCKMRYGNVIEHGFIGGLFRREWCYQTRLLMLLSLALTLVDWSYYIINYVNVNLNRADFFYFLWMPLVLYILSLIYLGSRYYSMWVYYCHNDEGHYVETPGATTLRFLLINDNRMLIDLPGLDTTRNSAARGVKFDTPVSVKLPYRENESLSDAISLFRQRTGIADAEIRHIYNSPDPVTYQNMFHYFAFIPGSGLPEGAQISGEWLTLGEIYELGRYGAINRTLISELRRIYEVAMAWKTYDREGRRLYDIKHYQPTFRLRDLHKWDVDYDDETWLRVRQLNQDKPLWRLRSLFRKAADKLTMQA